MRISRLMLALAMYCHQLHAEPPRLIVQIVVDQFRADLLRQYRSQWQDRGFGYFLQHGIQFASATQAHANTVTCVGHATIATGAYPALHGIVANDWFDSAKNKMVYCAEDSSAPILPSPRNKQLPEPRSPRSLAVSNFADELVLAKKGRAFAVSFKDRSAIMLAGHAGTAYWFDKINGGFISSTYYMTHYPTWVNAFNKHFTPQDIHWNISKPRQDYLYKDSENRAGSFRDYGSQFPFQLKTNHPLYYKYLSMTPMADELTADFAIDMLEHEAIGQQKNHTDYLAVSFSGIDAIGHQFGPKSIASEDSLLRLDHSLVRLINTIDQRVGLANVLFVLTADHGVSDNRTYLKSYRMPLNKKIDLASLKTYVSERLQTVHHLPAKAIAAIEPPYVYLDETLIQQQGKDVGAIERDLINNAPKLRGIYKIMRLRDQSDAVLSPLVVRMGYPKRSGNLFVVTEPYEGIFDKQEERVSHGSIWTYDRVVPLVFAHQHFTQKTHYRPVETVDIAPTLSALLSIKPPSGSVGRVLHEPIEALASSH